MKKIFKLSLALFLLLTTVSCSDKVVENTEEIRIGIVETTGDKYKSSIHWYDKELEELDVQELKYAGLGSSFNAPVYYEDEIYLIPEGLFTKRDTEKVISINKYDFTINEYSVPNIALKQVAVNDDYIYVNSNLNYQTHISRINKKTDEFDEIIFDGAYFSNIIAIDDKIYIFGNMLEEFDKNHMYVTDKELNEVESFDISEYGRDISKYLIDNGFLYVTTNPYDESDELTYLLKINIDNNHIEAINLDEKYNDSILAYKGKILVSHNDIVTQEGSKLSILDENEKITKKDIGTDLEFVDLIDDYLIVSDQEKISLFDIENDFKLIKEVSIDKREDTYISKMIIID